MSGGTSGAGASVHIPRAVRGALWDTTDWLGTWWPAAVLGVVVAVLVVVLVVLVRRARSRRREGLRTRRRPIAVTAVVLALALVLGGAASANAVSGYVPSVDALAVQVDALTGGIGGDHAGAGRGSTVGAVQITAPPALGITDTQAWVYTPPGYAEHPQRRYPVAYLLHGTPGHAADWFAAGGVAHQVDVLIAAHLVRPMIVVAPDTNGAGLRDSECLDVEGGRGPQVETYLERVVVPYVDHRYRTLADRQDRAIGGMSSGGYCALDQGLRHLDVYGSIIALEPYGDPGSGGRAALPGDEAAFVAHSPSRYVPTMTFPHPVSVFVDEGSRASVADAAGADLLVAELRARGQHVVTRTEVGHGHSWLEAAEGVPYGLIMASRAMPPAPVPA